MDRNSIREEIVKDFKEKENKIQVLEKALELACDKLDYSSPFCCKYYQREGKSCTESGVCKNCYTDYFKLKAKGIINAKES